MMIYESFDSSVRLLNFNTLQDDVMVRWANEITIYESHNLLLTLTWVITMTCVGPGIY